MEKKSKKKHHKTSKEKKSKKKKKHHKKHKSKRKESSSSSSDEHEEPNYVTASLLISRLIELSAENGQDVLNLLEMLDDQVAIDVAGIQDGQVKQLLNEFFKQVLFPQNDDKEYFKPSGGRCLVGEFQHLFPLKKCASPPKRSIGPMLPPSSPQQQPPTYPKEDDDDVVIGPALPGTCGFRSADPEIEAAMEKRRRELEESEWKKVRGEAEEGSLTTQKRKREEWMTMMPRDSTISAALGQYGDKKQRQFASREKQEVDATWFASPEERQRHEQAKAEIELFGYAKTVSAGPLPNAIPEAKDRVNSSIMPNANPKEDEQVRQSLQQIQEARGDSLLARHQQKQIQKKASESSESHGWNRERDLVRKKELSKTDAESMIKNAQQMSSRFAAPQRTRQFL